MGLFWLPAAAKSENPSFVWWVVVVVNGNASEVWEWHWLDLIWESDEWGPGPCLVCASSPNKAEKQFVENGPITDFCYELRNVLAS